jgi:dipeptidase
MKRKRILKKAFIFTLVVMLVISNSVTALACTAFYLGKDTTSNGSVIWGRSEDISASYRKQFMVHPAETHEDGEMFVSSSGFTWPYPEKTLRYTLIKDSYLNERQTPEPYAEAGMNEKNVAISATVTLSAGKTAIVGTSGIDRHVTTRNGGLAEQDLATVVLMQATSARDAVELVARIVDEKGSAGREGFFVSDPNEVWYMQLLSGHQYIAVKCPDDMVGFSPNITGNVYSNINDTENVIASPGLISVAEQAGTLVLDDDGFIKVADSYGNPMTNVPARLWLGHYYLRGQEAADALLPGYMDFFSAPRNTKYTLYEAMRLLAFRGEDTPKYAGSGTSNSTAIGNDGTVEAHVFETRDNMPDALATIEWLCVAPPEFGVYVPHYSSLITSTFDKYYSPDSNAYNNNDPDDNSMYYVFRELFTLCKGPRNSTNLGSLEMRTRYGAKVKEFWERYQLSLIAQQADVDKAMLEFYNESPVLAQKKATRISHAISKETYEYAKQILKELKEFQNAQTEGQFVPSVLLDEKALPHYSFDALNDKTVVIEVEPGIVARVNGYEITSSSSTYERTEYVEENSDLLLNISADVDRVVRVIVNGNIIADLNRNHGDGNYNFIIEGIKEDSTIVIRYIPEDLINARNDLENKILSKEYTQATTLLAMNVLNNVDEAIANGLDVVNKDELIKSIDDAIDTLIKRNQVSIKVAPNVILNEEREITLIVSVDYLEGVDVMESFIRIEDENFEFTNVKALVDDVIFAKNVDYYKDGSTAYFNIAKVGGLADAAKLDVAEITVALKEDMNATSLEAILDSIAMYVGFIDENNHYSIEIPCLIANDRAETVIWIPGDVDGDFNGDDTVNGADLAIAITYYGAQEEDLDWYTSGAWRVDFNRDNKVDILDLTISAYLAANVQLEQEELIIVDEQVEQEAPFVEEDQVEEEENVEPEDEVLEDNINDDEEEPSEDVEQSNQDEQEEQ